MEDVSVLASSTTYNIGFQFVFRIFTFALNGFLLRIISRELLGVANVRLMLLYTTLSFLIREPFRRAGVQRIERLESTKADNFTNNSPKLKRTWAPFVNVLWFCPILALPLVILACSIWIQCLKRPDSDLVPYYQESVWIYGGSIFVESLAEPLWIVGQQMQCVRLKVVIESLQVFWRSILVGLLLIVYPHWSLMAFSIGMITSSLLYAGLYFAYFWNYAPKNLQADRNADYHYRSFRDLLPKPSLGLDRDLKQLVGSFWAHSLVKQLLTEGERYVMTFFNVLDFSDQGVYDVIHNLGSLVARFLFAPLEESAYSYFSLTLYRDRPARDQDPERFPIATKVLGALLKLTLLVGLIICTFGLSYSWLALNLYGGKIISTGIGPTLLRWYCVYVLLLSMNGISECFAFAAMSKEQVSRHQRFLFLFCLAFLCAAIVLTSKFGTVGFVWANCVNMGFRIVYSLRFISHFYDDIPPLRPLVSMVPSVHVVIALIVSLVFCCLSNRIFCCEGVFNTGAHVAVGGLCLFGTVMTVHSSDQELMHFVETFLVRKKYKDK